MNREPNHSLGVYDNPQYYEIAFAFRDIPGEVDVFEECFRRFSLIQVESILELGCGNSPHMEELVRRGYQYNGIDLSDAMLEYSRQKAARIAAQVNLIQADMLDFDLEFKCDFVYITLGSLCARSTQELSSHLDSVGQVLRSGGLYLLDWCVHFEPPWHAGTTSWEIERGGIRIKTTVLWDLLDQVEQTFQETIRLDVDDHGKRFLLEETQVKKAIYPQEFLAIVRSSNHFEFIGWWNNWDLSEPLDQAQTISRPITLLRHT